MVVAHAGDVGRSVHAGGVVSVPVGAWVVSYWADKSAGTTAWSAPAGLTVRDAGFGSGSGRFGVLVADLGGPVAAGSYGPLTATANSTSTNAEAWTIALPPLAPPVGVVVVRGWFRSWGVGMRWGVR